jgi:hypothetical protein
MFLTFICFFKGFKGEPKHVNTELFFIFPTVGVGVQPLQLGA